MRKKLDKILAMQKNLNGICKDNADRVRIVEAKLRDLDTNGEFGDKTAAVRNQSQMAYVSSLKLKMADF